jgi:hypothetical protein
LVETRLKLREDCGDEVAVMPSRLSNQEWFEDPRLVSVM